MTSSDAEWYRIIENLVQGTHEHIKCGKLAHNVQIVHKESRAAIVSKSQQSNLKSLPVLAWRGQSSHTHRATTRENLFRSRQFEQHCKRFSLFFTVLHGSWMFLVSQTKASLARLEREDWDAIKQQDVKDNLKTQDRHKTQQILVTYHCAVVSFFSGASFSREAKGSKTKNFVSKFAKFFRFLWGWQMAMSAFRRHYRSCETIDLRSPVSSFQDPSVLFQEARDCFKVLLLQRPTGLQSEWNIRPTVAYRPTVCHLLGPTVSLSDCRSPLFADWEHIHSQTRGANLRESKNRHEKTLNPLVNHCETPQNAFRSYESTPTCSQGYAARNKWPGVHQPAVAGKRLVHVVWNFTGLLPKFSMCLPQKGVVCN